MREPSRAVRRCESVCCRPWRCWSIERIFTLPARRVRGILPARALGSIMCIWPGSIVRDDSRCSTLCRALNTQRPRALVFQPKGVMEQSTDMIPPPHAWRHLPVPFFLARPMPARRGRVRIGREGGDGRWVKAGEVCVRMLQASPHTSPTPHHTREILTESDILPIWDPLSRTLFPRAVNTAFTVRGIMSERAAR